MVSAIAALTLSESLTSVSMKEASPPLFLPVLQADKAADSPTIGSISAMITFAPSSVKRSAVARPIPPHLR